MIDQLRQIAIFSKAIDHGSFRGAARDLRLSPSVVSHHISQLEEELGCALLYRSTRKLALTREGERLLACAHEMLAAAEYGVSAVSSSIRKVTGELRLTIPSVLNRSPLTDFIAEFSMKYPSIKLQLDYSDTRQGIIEGGYDIAIRMGIHSRPSATTRKLFSVKRCLIASRAYVQSRAKVTEPQQLLDWDWLELSPVQHIKPTFHKSGKKPVTLKPIAHIAVNDAQALYRFAHSGAGLAVVPEFLATEGFASDEVVSVLPDWSLNSIDVFAAWPSNVPKHGLVKLLVEELSKGKLTQ